MRHSGKTYEPTFKAAFYGGSTNIKAIRGVRITPDDKSYKRWIGESWYADLNINCL